MTDVGTVITRRLWLFKASWRYRTGVLGLVRGVVDLIARSPREQ